MHRENGSNARFVETYCEIHGRYGDKVYRRKRNGEPWVYDYIYKPKYEPTVLSRRSSCVARAAAQLSNPRHKGYKTILQKIYYYTPYFVYAGSYDFSCNTFFKLREKGVYGIESGGFVIKMKLAPRTKVNFVFEAGREYVIKCYKDNRLYCQRKVVVTDAEEELESVYASWFRDHLAEIVSYQLPYYGRQKVYRRGIRPPSWLQSITGKTEQGILYKSSRHERFMYVRAPYVHEHNTAGDHFYAVQSNINTCWKVVSAEFRQVWEKYHIRWFDANYRKRWKKVQQHHLWSKLIFRAGAVLGFDLEDLSPDNWLWGVETLGDLLDVCGMKWYGLSPGELRTRIFINEIP